MSGASQLVTAYNRVSDELTVLLNKSCDELIDPVLCHSSLFVLALVTWHVWIINFLKT